MPFLLPSVRMGPGVDLAQPLDAHLGVDLRRLEAPVAKQDLDKADVGPVPVHARRAAVP